MVRFKEFYFEEMDIGKLVNDWLDKNPEVIILSHDYISAEQKSTGRGLLIKYEVSKGFIEKDINYEDYDADYWVEDDTEDEEEYDYETARLEKFNESPNVDFRDDLKNYNYTEPNTERNKGFFNKLIKLFE